MLEVWIAVVAVSSFVLGFLTCVGCLAFMVAKDLEKGLRDD